MIRHSNKEKRLQWARSHLNDPFLDVIWTDETSVQFETYKRFCCRKRNQPLKVKPCSKHSIKVHVWAGINWRGRTEMVIFDGIMDANMYISILRHGLLPFIH